MLDDSTREDKTRGGDGSRDRGEKWLTEGEKRLEEIRVGRRGDTERDKGEGGRRKDMREGRRRGEREEISEGSKKEGEGRRMERKLRVDKE